MKKYSLSWIILSVCFLGLMKSVQADVLSGAVYDNGDGTYAVSAQDEMGHRFVGFADLQGEGILNMTIGDSYGETYRGRAIENDQGGYDLHLINLSSGNPTTGTLDKN